MTMHPRSGEWGRRSIGRRKFLRDSAATAVAMSSFGVLLSACGSNGSPRRASSIQVASPENPVALDLFDDNPAIDSGLEPEAGPLKLFNWSEYIWPRVVKDFEKEYGVEVEITTFYNMSEAISKLRAGGIDFDVFFPTIDVLPKLVAAKLLQPVNHDYLPNLDANVWPELTSPFYDRNSRYTVPYTVYTTGIGYSADAVSEDVGSLENPYDIFWDSQYAGKVGIYDDYREAMSMVMLRNGHTDINSGDPEVLEVTKNDLLAHSDSVRVKTTIDGAYVGLPEGKFVLHQAWSGDMVAAPFYMPKGGDPSVLRYWTPPDGKGSVGNDLLSIPSTATNPVLAHHFLNFMLDNDVAIKNFSWVGYQPPLTAMDPNRLITDEYVLETLKPAIVRPENFRKGYRQLALPPDVDSLWQGVWSEFRGGA
jgi:spermidine/putrescine transport system substrate-binding protein